MRFGPKFITFCSPNVRIILNATVTRIDTDETGAALKGPTASRATHAARLRRGQSGEAIEGSSGQREAF
jgi:hypothetical protein